MGDNARIIFESGVTNYECAGAVSSMGFTGLLLGEAAAKNPELRKGFVDSFIKAEETENARFWMDYANEDEHQKEISNTGKSFKICGLTRIEDALAADELGAKFLGFIFADAFPRSVSRDGRLEKLLPELANLKAKKVAVIVDLDSPESKKAVQLVKDGIFDLIQFHKIPYEKVDKKLLELPHYFAVNNLEEYEKLVSKGEMRVLLDSKKLDRSKIADNSLLYDIKWIAGGITPDNVCEITKGISPELIDVSGGVEVENQIGIKDVNKIKQLIFFDR